MFLSLGLINGFTMFHGIFDSYYYDENPNFIPIGKIHFGIILMGLTYIIGLIFYLNKIPEKYFPKKFDIWMNSHTIFHIFVVLAASIFLVTMFLLYDERNSRMCVFE